MVGWKGSTLCAALHHFVLPLKQTASKVSNYECYYGIMELQYTINFRSTTILRLRNVRHFFNSKQDVQLTMYASIREE
jgi:hypothetical protein